MTLDTEKFWETRLSNDLSLRGTGHRAFDLNYNRWLYRSQFDTLDLILEKRQINLNGKSLLDVGSGGGVFINYFSNKGCNPIVGVDITKASIEHLRNQFPDKTFFHADIASPALPIDGTFNIVTAISVMYHIVSDEKFNRALMNMVSLLSPGGYIIVCDQFRPTRLIEPKHVRMRPIAAYRNIFENTSIKILDMLPIYYLLNRTYIPFIGPRFINRFKLGEFFYQMDRRLRNLGWNFLSGMKFMIAKKTD